jgi:DNA-binding NarL/FixJ family response regulator
MPFACLGAAGGPGEHSGIRFPTVDDTGSPLTPRQQQVAELIAQGLSSKRIARELGLSIRTVEAQVFAARARLGSPLRPRHALLLHVLQGRPE